MTDKTDIRQLRSKKRRRSAREETAHPVILACDTSTTTGSAAIIEGGKVTAETVVKSKMSHSLRILNDIEAMLAQRELKKEEIDALVTAGGPGSFTGVRIAMSTMKGLAFSLNRPLISISSLTALAYPLFNRNMPVLAAFDAKRREVYGAVFSADGTCLVEQAALTPAVLAEKCIQAVGGECPIICAGEGVTAYNEVFQETLGHRIIRAAAFEDYVRSSVLGIIGTDHFARNEFCDINTVEPVYLRRSEAEINLHRKLES